MVRRIIFIAIGMVFLALLGFRLYQELGTDPAADAGRASGGGPSGGRAGGGPAFLVETGTVESRTFESRLEVVGELRPAASVEVMSRISGRLQQLLVDRGDWVRKGQLLVVVEDADLQQQIRRSEAALEVAKAGRNREQAAFENLQVQVNRFRQLHEEKLISTHELEDLESRMHVAQAELQLAEAQIAQAEAALHELNIQQQYTRVYSPLDGFVGTRYVDPGALVSPSVPIVSVLDLSRVKTVVPITEDVLRTVRAGLSARIIVDTFPDREFFGTITRISPFLDPETRSAVAEIEIPNQGQMLKAGMFARAVIDVNIQQTSLSIPRSALLTRTNQKGVYLLSAESTAIFQAIQIGRIAGNHVEVLQGLEEGQVIVTTGAQNLNDGDRVGVKDGESAPKVSPVISELTQSKREIP